MNTLTMIAALAFSCSFSQGVSPDQIASAQNVQPVEQQLNSTAGAEGIGSWIGFIRAALDIDWDGRGFLCAWSGSTCHAKMGIGLGDRSMRERMPDETAGFPEGSLPGALTTYNGDPVGPGATVLGERTLTIHSSDVVGGELPDGTTIFIPQQPIEFDPLREAYFFYYYTIGG